MLKKGSIRQIIRGLLILIIASLGASFLFYLSAAPILTVGFEKEEKTYEEIFLSPGVAANCCPIEVAVSENRIHIRYTADFYGIAFFTVSTSDAPFSSPDPYVALEAQSSKRFS